MVISKKTLEEAVGADRMEEILEKEWKTAEVPSEEELKKEELKSPMARNNPNSRKNLVQYNKNKSKELKEKVLSGIVVTEKEEDIDPTTILDASVDLELIKKLLPVNEVMISRREQEQFWNTINVLLKDFDPDELTSSDIDDIVKMALNSVLETRLLVVSKGSAKMILEGGNTMEKFRKHSEKIKESLAARRRDRVDPKNKVSFSIVDLAVAVDEEKKAEYQQKIDQMLKDEQEFEFNTRYKPVKDGS